MNYIDAVKSDSAISSKLTEKEIEKIFSPESHLGASPEIIANVNSLVQKACRKFT